MFRFSSLHIGNIYALPTLLMPRPPGRAAFGRPLPGSPERDCGPGCLSVRAHGTVTGREPRMPRDTVFRASSSDSLPSWVFREVTGPGPGGRDSDDSFRQNPGLGWKIHMSEKWRSVKLQVTVQSAGADSSRAGPGPSNCVAPLSKFI